jgi:hypothetical protein
MVCQVCGASAGLVPTCPHCGSKLYSEPIEFALPFGMLAFFVVMVVLGRKQLSPAALDGWICMLALLFVAICSALNGHLKLRALARTSGLDTPSQARVSHPFSAHFIRRARLNVAGQLKSLPATIKVCSSGGSWMLLLWSVVWTAGSTRCATGAYHPGQPFAASLFTFCMWLVTAGVGIAAFVHTANEMLLLAIVRFEAGAITVSSRSLFGRQIWRERLDSYRGVAGRLRLLTLSSTEVNVRTQRVFQVLLVHPDSEKTILLDQSTSFEGLRARCEHYAKLLGVKCLDDDLTDNGGSSTISSYQAF